MNFYTNGGTEQCGLVNQLVRPGKDCCEDCECSNPEVQFEPCNQAQNVGSALLKVNHGRDVGNGLPKEALAWEDLQAEIDGGQPLVVTIEWQGALRGQSHAIVVYGYTDDRKVYLADPMKPGTIVTRPFDDFQYPTSDGKTFGIWKAAFRTC